MPLSHPARVASGITLGLVAVAAVLVLLYLYVPKIMNTKRNRHVVSKWERAYWAAWRKKRATFAVDRGPLAAAGAHTTIMMTYHSIDGIPGHIYEGLDRWAPHHRVYIFDDAGCEGFLVEHFPPAVADKFRSMAVGAHKADLFRYAWLYIHGGIYMDVKTILVRPVVELFPDRRAAATVLCRTGIYQGILASPPRNPLFLELLDHMLASTRVQHLADYMMFVRKMEECLRRDTNQAEGLQATAAIEAVHRCRGGLCDSMRKQDEAQDRGILRVTWRLWQERLHDAAVCGGARDRYGYCSRIHDAAREDPVVFITRDPSYGRSW